MNSHDHSGHASGMNFCPRCGHALESRVIDRTERRVCPRCDLIHWFDPKVACGTIPCIDGKVVLLRRAIEPAYGKWVFPGGYMDRGETTELAAIRETREECGLEVAVAGLVGVYSYPDSVVVIVVYECRVVDGEPVAASESLEMRLYAPHEIPWEDLAFPSTRAALLDWVRRHAPEVLPR